MSLRMPFVNQSAGRYGRRYAAGVGAVNRYGYAEAQFGVSAHVALYVHGITDPVHVPAAAVCHNNLAGLVSHVKGARYNIPAELPFYALQLYRLFA